MIKDFVHITLVLSKIEKNNQEFEKFLLFYLKI